MARKRVDLEYWRQTASLAYEQRDFRAALTALDSVTALFPGHEWGVDLRERIRRIQAQSRREAQRAAAGPEKPAPLSPDLEREVQAVYREAQQAFADGDLDRAIVGWEKVERLAPDYQSVREYLVNAYKFVGVDLYGQNRLDEAVTIWLKAAALAPDNGEIQGYIKRTENEIRKLRELSYEH